MRDVFDAFVGITLGILLTILVFWLATSIAPCPSPATNTVRIELPFLDPR